MASSHRGAPGGADKAGSGGVDATAVETVQDARADGPGETAADC